ncbi:MAG: thioredoxin-disulfide reductase [Bacteroidetes bacterium]|nr:MAG: thioredoxin-disulfide reductase [Bacteroidota bacterium]
MSEEITKVKSFIIGSGPAGYTAAIYASRANLSPVLYQGMQPGGQLTTTTEIENFPGYPEGTEGPKMMEDLQKQAENMGADIRWGVVTEADLSKRPFIIKTDDKKVFEAESVIISTGASAKYLGLKSENDFKGGGVSACATCDGFFYKGKPVAVVGGGDTAAEDALYLANITSKVYMIVRRDELRASKVMAQRVEDHPNIEVLWNHVTKEIVGEQKGFMKALNAAILENVKTGEEKKIDIEGFFVAIGHHPNTKLFKDQIKLDDQGYIITDADSTRTNIEGVFAAGDVQDHTYRQAITAAGSGCMAAIESERWLGEQ